MIPEGWRGEGTLLFGGSGFLGSAILRLFPEMISAGRSVPAAPNRHIPVPDFGDLSALRDVEFERVICCTGSSRHVELMKQPLPEALESQMMPSVLLLEQLQERPLRAFVRLSTVLLYDEMRATMPVDEESPIAPYRNRYLLSQYLGEQSAQYYDRYFPVMTLRLCNLFGPSAAARTDLVHEIVTQLRSGGRATIRTRIPERDFLFVEDGARAVAALTWAERGGIYHLGPDEAAAVGRVADILARLSGGTVQSREEPVQGIPSIHVNSGKLRAATGWRPRYSLEEGLAKTWGAAHAARH